MRYLYVLVMGMVLGSCTMKPEAYVNYDERVKFNEYSTFAWLPVDPEQCDEAENTVYNELFNNELTRRNIKTSANEELFRRGFQLNVDSPDVLIQYQMIFDKKEYIVSAPVQSNPNRWVGINNVQPLTNAPGIPIPNTYSRLSGNYTIVPDNYTYTGGGNVFPPVNNINNGLNGGYWGGYYEPYNSSVYGYGGFYNNVPYTIGTYFEKSEYEEGTLIVDIIDRKENKLIWRGWSQSAIQNPATASEEFKTQIREIIKKFPGQSVVEQADNIARARR